MKTKIKTFHGVLPIFGETTEEFDLDKKMSDWIEEVDPIIVDIRYSCSGNKHYGGIGSALIMYKEKKNKKK